ncbi:MAG: hypothetical protein NTZ85_05725 [Bacteroidia bacterium]|nr:hypothetical protein [Bacteroidia bacterium]
MKIEKNKVISFIYELREANSAGRIIEALEEIASTGYSCSSCSSFNKESGCAESCN